MMNRPLQHQIDQPPQDEPAAWNEHALSADTLLDGKVRLRQPVSGYRAAIDPVFLAAAVAAGPGDLVCEAGCGAGAALLCLAWRIPACRITGIERDTRIADLARANAADNWFSERIDIIAGDIANPPDGLTGGSFDHVMVNPPHLDPARAQSPPDADRAAAMVEGDAAVADWIAFAYSMLRDRGAVTLIHRADRLDHVIAALDGRFGGIAVFPLWPAKGRAAKRAILRARKNAGGPMSLLPGIVLHGDDGQFTPAADAVLREGRALEF
jgi:tRNA1(Val) A37 N6-methylase TrmN6